MPEQLEPDNLARLPAPCDFKIGDIVRLKSSHTEMTVIDIISAGRGRLAAKKVLVNWTSDGGDLYENEYDPRVLTLVREGGQDE
jgi:hypothetical protein